MKPNPNALYCSCCGKQAVNREVFSLELDHITPLEGSVRDVGSKSVICVYCKVDIDNDAGLVSEKGD